MSSGLVENWLRQTTHAYAATLVLLCQKSVHGSTGSPRTDGSTRKFNCPAVRPELVEGRTAAYDTVILVAVEKCYFILPHADDTDFRLCSRDSCKLARYPSAPKDGCRRYGYRKRSRNSGIYFLFLFRTTPRRLTPADSNSFLILRATSIFVRSASTTNMTPSTLEARKEDSE